MARSSNGNAGCINGFFSYGLGGAILESQKVNKNVIEPREVLGASKSDRAKG
jgi:hypothetical protein